MRPLRLVSMLAVGGLLSIPLRADEPAFTPPKQFSADETITTKTGSAGPIHLCVDNDKERTEMGNKGVAMINIARPDRLKMYMVYPWKEVMIMPMNERMAAQVRAAHGQDAKFEYLGPEMAEGVVCTKYKVTAKHGEVSFWWIDGSKGVPVKQAEENGSSSVTFKNFVIGPQDTVLFEPPADYKVRDRTVPTKPNAGQMQGAPQSSSPTK